MSSSTKITKARTACIAFGSMILGGVIFGVSSLIGGLFFDWVVGVAAVSCFLLLRSMIRELK